MNTTNINIAIDVIAALSDKTLRGNIFVMDDGLLNSRNKGTDHLVTVCSAGQLIKWSIYAIDLQTPVSIKSISFSQTEKDNNEDIPNNHYTNLDLNEWSGYVPNYLLPNKQYKYKLELQMGEGQYSILSIDSLCLELI
ncbi:hypothetical protein [Saccharicrinis aurantiacus]|uniref:hypothetical protein n=1 Tax=Saccharicrinis aurantiacus TaxID=1849719 RepID=UPI00094F6E60|nr:hypothetical protein [Saccharicrinis aurantiacus]